jgi:hypothetical protein
MEGSNNIGAYKLPVKDCTESEKNVYFSLADMQKGDNSGSTDTDSRTDTPDGGYTDIYKRSGKSVKRG